MICTFKWVRNMNSFSNKDGRSHSGKAMERNAGKEGQAVGTNSILEVLGTQGKREDDSRSDGMSLRRFFSG